MGLHLSVEKKRIETFQDSYNKNNLINKFGLTVSEWLDDRVDEDNFIIGENIESMLNQLRSREKIFKKNVLKESIEDSEEYYLKYEELILFLEHALKNNLPIAASY